MLFKTFIFIREPYYSAVVQKIKMSGSVDVLRVTTSSPDKYE